VGIVIVLAASIAIQIPEKRGETATDVRLTLAE
jgi:hypothetical protein